MLVEKEKSWLGERGWEILYQLQMAANKTRWSTQSVRTVDGALQCDQHILSTNKSCDLELLRSFDALNIGASSRG